MARANTIFQLRVTLTGIRPPIWRRVQVKDCTLATLHEIIQICLGWQDYHMWAFEVDGEEYGEDTSGELQMQSARKTRLSQLVEAGGKKFGYVYDFGDNWRHVVQIENMLEAEPEVKYPRCIDGRRAGPPEDCGRPWGYSKLLEAIQNPQHEQRKEMLDWVGGDFDPAAFNLEAVNKKLAASR